MWGAQGKYDQAEPLFKRSLAIREKALGPEHPDVATALESQAKILRAAKREAEAVPMEARATAIRARHARDNPGERSGAGEKGTTGAGGAE